MEKAIIGIDIGGTNTVIGIFDRDLALLEKVSIPTLKPNFPAITNNPKEYFDLLTDEITKLADKNGYQDRIQCVGIGVPGKINPKKGIAIRAVNLGYRDVPFADEMKNRLQVPVFIDNDVRTYTRGEAQAGAGKGYNNLISITIGTGMAASVMIDGNMVVGSDFFAGEIGHDPVQGVETLCNCGKKGCLETIASATGISRLATEAIQTNQSTILKEIERPITSKDVYEAALKGDKVALEVFDYVGKTLGYKLLSAIYLVNPDVIIIGGGGAQAGKLITNPVEEIIKENYLNDKLPQVKIGQLGDSAGLIGAASLAIANK